MYITFLSTPVCFSGYVYVNWHATYVYNIELCKFMCVCIYIYIYIKIFFNIVTTLFAGADLLGPWVCFCLHVYATYQFVEWSVSHWGVLVITHVPHEYMTQHSVMSYIWLGWLHTSLWDDLFWLYSYLCVNSIHSYLLPIHSLFTVYFFLNVMQVYLLGTLTRCLSTWMRH